MFYYYSVSIKSALSTVYLYYLSLRRRDTTYYIFIDATLRLRFSLPFRQFRTNSTETEYLL